MKIKCEYCDSMFDDTLEKCPSCGAPNPNVRRSTSDQPTTIEGLKEWYASKGLPPEEVTRFFIGKDYRGAKAFGIYRDERTGNFVVYKNKADGSRAVRYEGTDEAYAVNELLTRLKQEILQQKAANLNKPGGGSGGNGSGGNRRKKKNSGASVFAFFFILFVMAVPFGALFFMRTYEMPSKTGYYRCNDEAYYRHLLFYHYTSGDGWAVFDPEKNDWRETVVYPSGKFDKQRNAKRYFLSEEYDPSYGGYDFKDSLVYDDYLHGFTVTRGYYAYNDQVYYHMKSDNDMGWYVYNADDGDWDDVFFSDVPADLKHQSVAQDFWYTPDWDSETQITDFTETEDYQDYQEELRRAEEARERQQNDTSYDNDNDYSWDSDDSWDSGGTDWDSDW